MRQELKESETQLLDRAIEWFGDVQEKASRLTSGNVSHHAMMIRGFAKNCVEFLTEYRMNEEDRRRRVWLIVAPREAGGMVYARVFASKERAEEAMSDKETYPPNCHVIDRYIEE